MPLLMDVHTRGDSRTLRDVAHAHAADLRLRGGHDVHYLRYWVDEARGKVFCLVDAPDAGGPAAVHRRAYSLLAKEISDSKDVPAQTNPRRFDTAEIYRLSEGE